MFQEHFQAGVYISTSFFYPLHFSNFVYSVISTDSIQQRANEESIEFIRLIV